MEIVVVVLLVLFAITYILLRYRRLVMAKKKVDEIKVIIDTCIKQRLGIVQNLASIISAFPNQGKENANYLLKLKNDYILDEDVKVGQEINDRISKFMVILSRYPYIKNSQQYMYMQQIMANTEVTLKDAKDKYNQCVELYNVEKKKIPNNIISTLLEYDDGELI